jgi:hypothetical protein
MARDPYCGNCGYSLKGLTESSKCPECGRPLVEVLERGPLISYGRRYTSDIVIFGLPLLQIALGPHENEKTGRARGIIAIGDRAVGWLAIGGLARGLIACGGFAVGVVAIGGGTVGLISFGGFALGLLAAFGGIALGLHGFGGLVVACVGVSAGLALAYYARAGVAQAVHGVGGNVHDPAAISFFLDHAWIYGANSTGFKFAAWAGLAVFLWAALLFLIATAGYLSSTRRADRDPSRMR